MIKEPLLFFMGTALLIFLGLKLLYAVIFRFKNSLVFMDLFLKVIFS